jgi:acyl-CoA synthetase (AMP-forming)/AMP-acid ligase II
MAAEQLQVCYAMAENTFAVTQTSLRSVPRRLLVDRLALETRGVVIEIDEDTEAGSLLSCGGLIDGAQICIVDDTHSPVGDAVVGEVAVGGSYLFQGYYRRPRETAARLVGDWYYSGDLGFVHDGDLYITGRKDDLLILYGRNVYAHEIENCLSGCPGLVPGRAIALGLDNMHSGSRDLVVLAEIECAASAADLQRWIKRRVFDELGLSVAKVATMQKGWLAKSTSGKIARRLNHDRYQEMIVAERERR